MLAGSPSAIEVARFFDLSDLAGQLAGAAPGLVT